MRRILIAGIIAASLVAGSLTSPAQARAQEPIAPQATTLVKTKRVDVDGDGRKDKVRLYRVTASRWRVTVTTATGKRASKTFTSTIASDWGLASPWTNPIRMDGRAGVELPLMVAGGDGVVFRVLTWRKGRLVNEPKLGGQSWYVGGPLPEYQSYRFYTVKKVRYAEVAWLTPSGNGTTCSADVNRYAWTSTAWTFRKHYAVAATAGLCARYPGL